MFICHYTIEKDSEESSIFCSCAFIPRITGGEEYFVSVLLYAALRMAEKYFEPINYIFIKRHSKSIVMLI